MEYKVVFTEDAGNDFFDIYYYVAINDSFDNAERKNNFATSTMKRHAKCLQANTIEFIKRGEYMYIKL